MPIQELIPVLPVDDWGKAEQFYGGVLGFVDLWSFGEPAQYGGMCAGGAGTPSLHVSVYPAGEMPGPSEVYVSMASPAEVDALFEKVRAGGAEIVHEPGDREYQMRDFMVADPWGNRLSFGADIT